jgi:hypothetical protein
MFGLCDPVSKKLFRKRTRIVSGYALGSLARICDKGHTHEEVIRSVVVDGAHVKRSRLVGAYPTSMCNAWAEDLIVHSAQQSSARRLRLRSQLLARP